MSQSSLFSDILETATTVTETEKITQSKNSEISEIQGNPNKPIAIFKEQFIKPKDDLIDILAKKSSPLFLNTDSDVSKLPPKSILKQDKLISELPKQPKSPKTPKTSDKKRKPKVEDDPLGLFTRGSTVYLLRDRQVTKEVIKINYQKKKKRQKSSVHASSKKQEKVGKIVEHGC